MNELKERQLHRIGAVFGVLEGKMNDERVSSGNSKETWKDRPSI